MGIKYINALIKRAGINNSFKTKLYNIEMSW